MRKACLSNVFVADLELGAHQLNEAHLANKGDVGFLEDFNVGKGPQGGGGEQTTLWQGVLENCINIVKCGEERCCVAVCKAET